MQHNPTWTENKVARAYHVSRQHGDTPIFFILSGVHCMAAHTGLQLIKSHFIGKLWDFVEKHYTKDFKNLISSRVLEWNSFVVIAQKLWWKEAFDADKDIYKTKKAYVEIIHYWLWLLNTDKIHV